MKILIQERQIRAAKRTESPTDLIYLLKGVAHRAKGSLTIQPVFLAADGSGSSVSALAPIRRATSAATRYDLA